MDTTPPPGTLLRDWRQRRRLSQLDLALDAEISTRHLSFIETGRSRPSRGLLLHLAELLQLPLRERNRLLLAAGFAPHYDERALTATPLAPALQALERLLQAHEPYPALVVDRHWNLVRGNRMAGLFLAGVAAPLRAAPCNVLRVTLHPQGLAPLIVNLGEWRRHLLARLRAQVAASGDATLAELLQELAAMPVLPGEDQPGGYTSPAPDVLTLFRLRSPLGELALFSTITVFGTPVDITLAELALESFYPADADTAARLRRLAEETG
ncbi:MAG: helix-turn-helix transcriptional regulator [Rhodanobacteraceae bacterium]|nr:helix-turn-helix transcriptional regulator [Rhodanobacteraceae bacterium]